MESVDDIYVKLSDAISIGDLEDIDRCLPYVGNLNDTDKLSLLKEAVLHGLPALISFLSPETIPADFRVQLLYGETRSVRGECARQLKLIKGCVRGAKLHALKIRLARILSAVSSLQQMPIREIPGLETYIDYQMSAKEIEKARSYLRHNVDEHSALLKAELEAYDFVPQKRCPSYCSLL